MSYYPPSTVIPIYSVYMGVAIFLTTLRFWVRLSYARTKLGMDDYLLLFGLLVAIACNAIQYYNSLKGTGGEAIKDPNERTLSVIVAHKVDWAMIVIEKASFGAVKLSILFFYRRIFGVWDSFRTANNFLLWIVGIWTVVFTLADVLICGAHPELIWGFDQSVALRRCGNRGALLLAFSVTSVVTDLPVLGLPFFYIGRLQMPRGKKWATSFVFLLGAVSTGASILRLIFLIVSYPVGRLNFAYTPPPDDETPLVLKIFNPTFWALTELWLGVWAANLPPCAPLLRSINVSFDRYFVNTSKVISSVYRRTWSKKSSTTSEELVKKDGVGGHHVVVEKRVENVSGSYLAPSYGSGRYGRGHGHGHGPGHMLSTNTSTASTLMTTTATINHEPEHRLPSRDTTPLVLETGGGSDTDTDRGRESSITSEQPPRLDPLEWTGTGHLSMLSRFPSSSESVNWTSLG